MTAPERGGPEGDAEGSERAEAAASERVEVVDESGKVLRTVTRSEMRGGRFRHRCTYVAVLDSTDRLVVHQRAAWKDVWPSRWDVAFGGVVGVGEAWDDAARRELAEEAGVEADLEPLVGPDAYGAPHVGTAYDDADVSVLGRAYLARHDGPFTFPDGEVVASDRIPLDDLDTWLATHPTCPDSVTFVVPAIRRGAV